MYPTFLVRDGALKGEGIGPGPYKAGQLPVRRVCSHARLVRKEGTANRDPELWPMVAKTGVARLALTTGAPVIPIAHWGAQDILPYGSKRPRLFPRRTVRMAAGPRVDLSRYAGPRLGASTLRAATADIMADITALLAGLRQETPPAVPYDPAVAGEILSARTSSGTQATSGAA